MTKTIVITVPEEIRNEVQRYDIERSSRRDIIAYILSGAVNVSEERFAQYQKEYDEKFAAFEQAKSNIEKNFVMPATSGKASNWSLDYSTCDVTITYEE
jgi:hypothetical protein